MLKAGLIKRSIVLKCLGQFSADLNLNVLCICLQIRSLIGLVLLSYHFHLNPEPL